MLDAETKRRIVPYSPYRTTPTFTHGARRLPPSGSTAGSARHAAFAPLRLDCGLRPLADSPSRGE